MPKKRLIKSHWIQRLRGLRPVLHRPRKRFAPDLIIPFLFIAALIVLTTQATSIADEWVEQNTQDIIRVLDTRETLKF